MFLLPFKPMVDKSFIFFSSSTVKHTEFLVFNNCLITYDISTLSQAWAL